MKSKLYFVFLITINYYSFAQTFRNGFDKYESGAGGAQGQGVSFHSNVKNYLGANECTYMESYIKMFKATKDKKYLDKFIIHSKRVQERRDDNITTLSSNQFEGFPALFYDDDGNYVCQIIGVSQVNTNSKGWSYVENIGNVNNPNCQYNTVRVLHSANLTFPMAEYVYYMMTDPDFIAVANEPVPAEAQGYYPNINPYYNVQTYSDYAVWLKSKITETIQYHECFWKKWDILGQQLGTCQNPNGLYDAGYFNDCTSTNKDALNMQCAMGKTLIMMYLVSIADGNPNSAYRCHITDIAILLQSQLQLNSLDNVSYTWCHTYNCLCKVGKINISNIEDIAHAYLVMSFADLCHQHNQYIFNFYQGSSVKLFYSTDMQKFANAFVKHIYQSPGNYAANTYGSNTNVCNTTDPNNIGSYAFLSKYNPYVYHIISQKFAGRAIYGGSGDLMGYAELALYQQEISNNPSFNNTYKRFFNPVAVQINNWYNTNISFPQNPVWSGSAGGDFDGNGEQEFAVIDNALGKISVFSLDNDAKFQQDATVTNSPNSWLYMAATNMDASAGDELLVSRTNYIDMLKRNGSTLNTITSLNIPNVSVIAAGNVDGVSGNECIAVNTSRDIFIVKYNGSNLSSTNIGNIGNSTVRAIAAGDFDGNPANGDEIAIALDNKKIQVWSLNNNTLTFLTEYIDAYNPNTIWGMAGISGGDFDSDGIDEIIVYDEYGTSQSSKEGAGFYILKIKNGVLSFSGREYFSANRGCGHVCSFRSSLYNKDVLVVPGNYNSYGEITVFSMDGVCPSIYLNNQNIDDNYTINNPYTNTNNNYAVDYHTNNILVASNFTVDNGSNVEFTAGNEIVLKAGFEAKAGSEFHGYISQTLSCSNNNTQSFRMVNNSTPEMEEYTSATNEFTEIGSIQNSLHKNGETQTNQNISNVSEDKFSIIPNPNNGEFKIILSETPSSVSVVNPLGIVVYENKQISANEINVNLKDVAKGLYIVKVNCNGKMLSKKIVID